MTEQQRDAREVLKYLDEIDQSIAKLRHEERRHYWQRTVNYFKPIAETSQQIRKLISARRPYGSQFIRMTWLLVQMQWQLFMYFQPSVLLGEGRQRASLKAAAVKNNQGNLIREYCQHCRETRYQAFKLDSAAQFIIDNWKQPLDKDFPLEKLKRLPDKAPAISTIKHHLNNAHANESSVVCSIFVPSPTWDDAMAFCKLQSIKPAKINYSQLKIVIDR